MTLYRFLFLAFTLCLSACGQGPQSGGGGGGGGTEVGNGATGGGEPPVVLQATYSSLLAMPLDWASGFHAADINGDKKMDMIVSGSPQVWLGNGDGTFIAGRNIDSSALDGMATADLNGDGKLDIVYKANLVSGLVVRFGLGDGTFSSKTTLNEFEGKHGFAKIQLADLNHDGILDIAAFHSDDLTDSGVMDTVETWINNGVGQFSRGGFKKLPFDFGKKLEIGDVNSDGNMDLITQSSTGRGTIIFFGDDKGGLTGMKQLVGEFGGTNLLVRDFNHDGKLDLVTRWTSVIGISLGLGDGNFQSYSIATRDAGTWDRSNGGEELEICDINSDGISDLVNAENTTGLIYIHIGKADGTFETVTSVQATKNAWTTLTADVNGDGLQDLLVRPFRRKDDPTDYPISIILQRPSINGQLQFAPFSN